MGRLAHFNLNHKINRSFIKTEQLTNGSNSGITAGVGESTLIHIENHRINAIFASF